VGGTNETLADVGPVGIATMELHGPGAERVLHGTPGQFSNAAFFQRTLISSRLKEAFLLVSRFSFSFNTLLTRISSLGVI
jgi:hypothetical protein